MYNPIKSAKVLWKSLDKKYKIEDADIKKFMVHKFLDFKMMVSKIMIS